MHYEVTETFQRCCHIHYCCSQIPVYPLRHESEPRVSQIRNTTYVFRLWTILQRQKGCSSLRLATAIIVVCMAGAYLVNNLRVNVLNVLDNSGLCGYLLLRPRVSMQWPQGSSPPSEALANC